LYTETTTFTLAAILSINYWRKPTYSWRRLLDIIYGRILFIVYFGYSVYYVRNPLYIVTIYPNLGLIAYCYYQSEMSWRENYPYWYRYHVLFHIILVYDLLFMIDSLPYEM
jgi:hypothetical protein